MKTYDEDDDFTFDDRSEPERLVMNCGYPGCCMPGEHFPSECHNAEDLLNALMAMEHIVTSDQANTQLP